MVTSPYPSRFPVVPDLPCCLSLTIVHRRGVVVPAGTQPCYLLAVTRNRRAASGASELLILAWLRHKFFHTSFARSFLAVTVGGAIIASLSAALGLAAGG
jgi:hypothetical protein